MNVVKILIVRVFAIAVAIEGGLIIDAVVSVRERACRTWAGSR